MIDVTVAELIRVHATHVVAPVHRRHPHGDGRPQHRRHERRVVIRRHVHPPPHGGLRFKRGVAACAVLARVRVVGGEDGTARELGRVRRGPVRGILVERIERVTLAPARASALARVRNAWCL